MSDLTQLLQAIDQGDPHAASQLLPLVYDELRKLAAQKLAQEKPGQTLDATALVHEAYLRLIGPADVARWENRRHFYAAAAEAMRRILVEQARGKGRWKRQGQRCRLELNESNCAGKERAEELLALDEALERLTTTNPQAGELVKLRYFAGFTNVQAAELLGVSPRKAQQIWAYARAWLREDLSAGDCT